MSVADRTSTVRPQASGAAVDLRRAPLAEIQAIDFRGQDREFWVDEVALFDRLAASWAGLDDAAWHLPGAAPSDAGGPDWSLHEHVAHVVDWYELAIDYVGVATETGRWPTDIDYDGGDFDRFNEGRRALYARRSPGSLRRAAVDGRARLLRVSAGLSDAEIRSDAAWGWVYNVFHGHALDHLRVVEPWADALRARQAANDPFGESPQPVAADPDAGIARFWRDDGAVFGLFDEIVGAMPEAAWTDREVTPGWTIADHVGHLVAWFGEAVRALDEHRLSGRWVEPPPEGIDTWNEARASRDRGTPRRVLLERFAAGRSRLEASARAMTVAEWLDPEGFSWAYDDLHGHVRAHLAMVAPHAARAGWPPA
jgi:Mycothiol maleylpyruvate isomerase N-terminal domain